MGDAPPIYGEDGENKSNIPMQVRPIITTQPGVQITPAPGTVWMPLPGAIPDVPQGLEYLTYIDNLIVHQKQELLEVAIGWESRNRYVMLNANGEQIYYAFEESATCARQCCGPRRGFVMHIVDNFKTEVFTIRRPFKCCAGFGGRCFACVGCCKSECVVEIPSIGVVGTIRQRQSCIAPCFEVKDGTGYRVFHIEGPCCKMWGCQDKEFQILTNSSVTIGAITKKWGGCIREAYTNADTFSVNFPIDLDVKLKAVLIGATFLIDFMEFEQPKDSS